MKTHKRVKFNRINWRSLTIAFTIAICFFISSNANRDEVYYADTPTVSVYMTATVVEATSTPESIETKIKKYFPKSHKTMLAIAKAESGLKPDAINYNCWYTKDGKISTTYVKYGGKSCKVEDRKYSFGVDCFLLQAHYPGRKSCPTDVTIDEHLQEMAELSKKRSFQPWVAYNEGKHLKHLANK